MIIKFVLILAATFLTCMIYFSAAMAAASFMLEPVRVKKDRRRGHPQG